MPVRFKPRSSRLISLLCALQLLAPAPFASTQSWAEDQPQSVATDAPKLSSDQLDSLIAPVALYPDPLLAQVLASSTSPLELVQLEQWLQKNKSLKDKELVPTRQGSPH